MTPTTTTDLSPLRCEVHYDTIEKSRTLAGIVNTEMNGARSNADGEEEREMRAAGFGGCGGSAWIGHLPSGSLDERPTKPPAASRADLRLFAAFRLVQSRAFLYLPYWIDWDRFTLGII